nr:hypothetical protein [Tanacetum cinerariifolium]
RDDIDENLPQLLDSRRGSHVSNVPGFKVDDFTSWKIIFIVFLDGLEPYFLKTLEEGPFIPMPAISTLENPLPKRQNQWTHSETRLVNQDKRLKRPSDIRDTKIAALRLKFNAFKSLEGEAVKGTFTRMKCLLNDLEINGVTIPQAEVNTTFVNALPRKWLSMNQTQRANNSIKNDSLAQLFRKYSYEEGLIDEIYEFETKRFIIGSSSSKAMISNVHSLNSGSDVKEDNKSSNEFMEDLNAEYQERTLLENQKRFYKRSGRVGAARKPMDKSKEICFTCGKTCHFQKDCPSNKTSTPSYPSLSKPYHKPKSYTPAFTHTPSPTPSKCNISQFQVIYDSHYSSLFILV